MAAAALDEPTPLCDTTPLLGGGVIKQCHPSRRFGHTVPPRRGLGWSYGQEIDNFEGGWTKNR
jgi:hypothetical protein